MLKMPNVINKVIHDLRALMKEVIPYVFVINEVHKCGRLKSCGHWKHGTDSKDYSK